MSNSFHDITISTITEETSDSKSLVFDVPSNLQDDFSFKAGQYLTLKFNIDGKEERRSYSLSSAPVHNQWRVCCKRVEKGLVSNHICDTLKEGDAVSVMAPEGRFVFEADEDRETRYFLFAAGSGITPIMSIATEILEREPLSTVYLLYGNKDENNVIYKGELEDMQRKYEGQFFLKYAYSSIPQKKGVLGGIFKKSNLELPFFPGRVAKDTIKKLLKVYPGYSAEKSKAYICGPGSMNKDVKSLLVQEGFDTGNVHFESFGTTAEAEDLPVSGGKSGTATVELDGETIVVPMGKNDSILDALLAKGYDPPHSCCSGACSSCMAKLVSGEVVMDVMHALDEEDIEDGYILTCQSRCVTDEIHVIYE